MPTLTGTLAYVTGQTVPPKAIRHVTVRATHTRTNGTELVTTRPVPVDHTDTLTLTLEPGTATLTIDLDTCLLYTSPSPRDGLLSRMPSSA